jgi:type IV secretory pathway VirB10-like protein
MEAPKKFKLSRRLMIFALPAVIIPTIVALVLMKGTDLGESADKAKEAAVKQKDREAAIGQRVSNPEQESLENLKKAELEIKSKKESERKNLPPPPDDTAVKSQEIRAKQLLQTREMIAGSLNDHERQSVLGSSGKSAEKQSGFVVYTAPPAKDGLLSGAANSVASAATIKQDGDGQGSAQDNGKTTPFLSSHDDKVSDEQTKVAKRVDGLYWIAPGTVIRAVLLNAIDTNLPGQIVARVTEPVYDSRYGKYLVVPSGTRLIGQYDSAIANGQTRVMMSFNSMITPSGGVVDLPSVRSSDALGRIGIPGELHTFFWRRMGVAALLALESVGFDRLANSQTTVTTNGSTATTTNTSQAAKIIADAANQEPWMKPVAPKITIEEGQLISVVTTTQIEVPPVANKR